MCVLIVCRGVDAGFPLIVGANREEDPQRPTAPPGLHVLGARRALFPQDRRHGGSWIGVNDLGLVVALTNFAPASGRDAALSRGLVVLQALHAASVAEALDGVRSFVRREEVRPFQVVIGDVESCVYLRCANGQETVAEITDRVSVLTSHHPPGGVQVGGLVSWGDTSAGEPTEVEARLDHLVVTLATGKGVDMQTGVSVNLNAEEGNWRTVSSSLIALPRDPGELRFRYCAGSPRTGPFRDYSGLARRLAD